MEADLLNLSKLLSMAMLIAATIEYVEIVRRREGWRSLARDRRVFAAEGLRALVRVFIADQTTWWPPNDLRRRTNSALRGKR
jgi:hypothetical protein